MNRKGVSGTMVTLVLFAAGAAVILLLYSTGIFPGLNAEAKKATCSFSIMSSLTNDFTSLDCPVQEISISQADVEKDQAFRKIASSIQDCWDNMGRGDLKPFYEDLVGMGDVVCKQCSEVKFSGDVRQSNLTGFRSYLSRNNALKSEKTYENYLYSDIDDWEEKVSDEMKTDQVYYAMFRICRESYLGESIPFSCSGMEPEILFLSGQEYNELDCDYEYD